jgi:hypothetical protein
MMMRNGRLTVVKVVVALLLGCVVVGVGAAPAFAEGEAPWWNVLVSAAPTNLPPGGTAKIVVAASNLGDGEANGSAVPITVSDRLPAGIVAVGMSSGVVRPLRYG